MLSRPDFVSKQIVFVFTSRGERLSFQNDNLVVRDEDNGIKLQTSCHQLFALFIVGHFTITSGLLQRAKTFCFSIHLANHSLKPYGSWYVATEGNVLLRRRQYEYRGLEIAQHLIRNKLESQLFLLRSERSKQEEERRAIENLQRYQERLSKPVGDLNSLLGIEGIASRIFFHAYFREFNWRGRRPRVKHDITNCLMDIGYTLLFHIVEGLLNIYGFDLYQGVYHQCFYQRKSLVCDIVEPFRSIIDHRIKKAYRLKQIRVDDFSIHAERYRLFGDASKPYVNWLVQAILDYKVNLFLFVQSYYRSFLRGVPVSEYPEFNIGKPIGDC